MFLLQYSLTLLKDLLSGSELYQILPRWQELTLAFLGLGVEEVLFVVTLAELEALHCEGVVLLLPENSGLRS